MTIQAALGTIIVAIIAAASYAATQYLKRIPTDHPEAFDKTKFLATVTLGALIGMVSALNGVIPDQTNVELQLILYAGATVIIENVIKIIYEMLKKYKFFD